MRPRRPTRAELVAYIHDRELELVFFEPAETFDGALLGIVWGYGQEPAVLYDEATVLARLERAGMTPEDAEEWFSFNTVGAYLGPATPRFCSFWAVTTADTKDGNRMDSELLATQRIAKILKTLDPAQQQNVLDFVGRRLHREQREREKAYGRVNGPQESTSLPMTFDAPVGGKY